MKERFVEFLYRHLLENTDLDETEITVDDIQTAEEALAIDELDLSSDDIETIACWYKQQCTEGGHDPDFGGYEDYE